MIVLDTNVVSEVLKPNPATTVLDWLASYPASELFTTSITEAEIRYGVALLPAGKKRNALAKAVGEVFLEDLEGRILPFDSNCARAYAEIASKRRALGRPISQLDAQIGSIAFSHAATIATRNTSDFEHCGVPVVNPWRDE
jgi:predicted nucleic acid-binding protein